MARARAGKTGKPRVKEAGIPSSELGGYEIALIKGKPWGHHPEKGWFFKYLVRRKGEVKFRKERKYTDAIDEASCIEEQQGFYARALLNGAMWMSDLNRNKKPPLRKGFKPKERLIEDQDRYIIPYTQTVKRYSVYIGQKTIRRGIKSIPEARRIRDEYLLGGANLKECKLCEKKPVWVGSKTSGTATLKHDEPGCPNRVIIRDKGMDAVVKLKAWNLRFASGAHLGAGYVTARKLFNLGVFDHVKKTKGGPKRRLKEEEVFDNSAFE